MVNLYFCKYKHINLKYKLWENSKFYNNFCNKSNNLCNCSVEINAANLKSKTIKIGHSLVTKNYITYFRKCMQLLHCFKNMCVLNDYPRTFSFDRHKVLIDLREPKQREMLIILCRHSFCC